MSSTKGISSKTTAMIVIVTMLVSAFSIMGMMTGEAHAAAKARKPAKVAGLTVTSGGQYAKASWKKATKKVKVGKKRYKVNYQLKATVKDIFGKTKTRNYTVKNATTYKILSNNPGTKYTFKIRGYYTKNGKKVYGAWSTAKSTTIPANGITVENARANNTGYLIAQANIVGTQKYKKYDKLVFTFNGVQETCAANDYVVFKDLRAGTLTVHGEYTVNGKAVRTTTAKKEMKASNKYNPNNNATNPTKPTTSTTPTSGGTGSKTDMNSTSDIKDERISFQSKSNTENIFTVVFANDVQSKYTWTATALDNKKLVGTLNLKSNTTPKINSKTWGKSYDNKFRYDVVTNWVCTDIRVEAKDSTGKVVFSKTFGYETNPDRIMTAPGNIRYGVGNPYYDRCIEVVDHIIDKSGANRVTGLKNKVNKIRGLSHQEECPASRSTKTRRSCTQKTTKNKDLTSRLL